ncbi:MAG: GspH/FimT family pseudopilin [Chromatiaceae bacterium]|nr:GspH/FimT family pseudopilin [Chromatiaceae bacterium]
MSTKQQGLTLVELMVTLAVAIVLLAVGMPLFTGVAANNRAVAEANALTAALKLARSEAVKRRVTVVVCSDDAGACGDAADWKDGWMVFVDENGNSVVDVDDEVLRTWAALSTESSITVTDGPTVAFQAAGDVAAQVTFELFNSAVTATDVNDKKRCTTVADSGQIRSTRGACP